MKTRVIKITDYENYVLQLPMSFIFNKSKRSFIQKELEQRHPRYTSEFCYDALLKFKNKRFILDVIVVSKLKLWEYKKNLFLPGIGLLLEKKKDLPRFVDKKLLVIFLFVLFLGLIGVSKILREKRLTKEQVMKIELMQVEENSLNNLMETTSEVGENGLSFLKQINSNNGNITSFTWKNTCGNEDIKAVLRNVYPEAVYDETYGGRVTIHYENKTPLFSYENKWPVKEVKSESFCSEYIIPELRDVIIENRGILIEENVKPQRIKFSLVEFNNIFSKISLLLQSRNVGVEQIVINSDVEKCLVEITLFEESTNMGLPVNYIDDFENLFISKKKIDKNERGTEKVESNQIVDCGKKIGSIVYGDGKKLLFYKNANGKTYSVMEDS